jgi:hypothetical protein
MRAGFVGAGRMGGPWWTDWSRPGMSWGASLGVLDDAIAALEAITRG